MDTKWQEYIFNKMFVMKCILSQIYYTVTGREWCHSEREYQWISWMASFIEILFLIHVYNTTYIVYLKYVCSMCSFDKFVRRIIVMKVELGYEVQLQCKLVGGMQVGSCMATTQFRREDKPFVNYFIVTKLQASAMKNPNGTFCQMSSDLTSLEVGVWHDSFSVTTHHTVDKS